MSNFDGRDFLRLPRNLQDTLYQLLDNLCPTDANTAETFNCHAVESSSYVADDHPELFFVNQEIHYRFAAVDDYSYGLYRQVAVSEGSCGNEVPVYQLIAFQPYNKNEKLDIHQPGGIVTPQELWTGTECTASQGCFHLIDTFNHLPAVGLKGVLYCADSQIQIHAVSSENGIIRFDHDERFFNACAEKSYSFSNEKYLDIGFTIKEGTGNTEINIPLYPVPMSAEKASLYDALLPQFSFNVILSREQDNLNVEIGRRNWPQGSLIHVEIMNTSGDLLDEFNLPGDQVRDGLSEMQVTHAFAAGVYHFSASLIVEGHPLIHRQQWVEIFPKTEGTVCQNVNSSTNQLVLFALGNEADLAIIKSLIYSRSDSLCNVYPFKAYCEAGLIQYYQAIIEGEPNFNAMITDSSCPIKNQIYLHVTQSDDNDTALGYYSTGFKQIVFKKSQDCLDPVKRGFLCDKDADTMVLYHEMGHAFGLPHHDFCGESPYFLSCSGLEQMHYYDPLKSWVHDSSYGSFWTQIRYFSPVLDAKKDCSFRPNDDQWQLTCDISPEVQVDCDQHAPWLSDPLWQKDLGAFLYADPTCNWGFAMEMNVAHLHDVMTYGPVIDFISRVREQQLRRPGEAFYPLNPINTKIICDELIRITGENLSGCKELYE